MDQGLLQKLNKWRADIAQKEGVALFRVFPNKSLEAIATMKPETKDEMLAIKGIKERKFEKYGADILALIKEGSIDIADTNIEGKNKPYSVSAFLDLLNSNLTNLNTRIQGEVSSLDMRGNYLFFSLKDKNDQSVLNCFMWNNNYKLCGISLEVGMEIIINAFPSVHKPSGRLSMQISIIELVGEGALKKAYEELKKKLEGEGLFAPERKKTIPDLPKKIGLITSETGAVIHDFLNNLGKFGYQIKFVDSRVEGQIAVSDLISSIEYFNGKDIDVLVIIRGGGSLESLQSFNNETLVRKIADCRMPVLCGIGHDKDVPLACFVADLAVSTPSIAANFLNKSWESAVKELSIFEKDIVYKYQEALHNNEARLEKMAGGLKKYFSKIFQEFNDLEYRLKDVLANMSFSIRDKIRILDDSLTALFRNFSFIIKNITKDLDDYSGFFLRRLESDLNNERKFLNNAEKTLRVSDPTRQLELGYSIVSLGGKVIKSVGQVSVGDSIAIQVSDGKINSTINKK